MNKEAVKNAISDFKKGKFIIILDDKARENEGDLVLAAEKATPQKINFMIKNARGLVCVPMLGQRLDKLNIPLMMQPNKKNTEFTKCKFTVSVDAKKGATTGISAFDRARTIKALIGKDTKSGDLAMPGHTFPLRCSEGGLLKRRGHTEASIEMAKLAGLYPAAVICEIIGENGRMAKMAELKSFAQRRDLKMIKVKNIVEYVV